MGAKKKSLASRLAKMSDEERMRYLQHKADIEEETRRRKEQLMTTFMKKKIKKEDGFSRLNIAKINQNWHQNLRKIKCEEMKANVVHMKKWIETTIELKNRTIKKLITELDEAEHQYSHNFQSHITHIDQIRERHQVFMSRLQKSYEDDRDYLLAITNAEKEHFLKLAEEEEAHLRTVIFGREEKTKKDLEKRKQKFIEQYDDIISTNQLEYEKMRFAQEAKISSIWRAIAAVFDTYVKRTDNRRLHFAELKRLDAESAADISKNQELITKQEREIDTLTAHLTAAETEREETTKMLSMSFTTMTEYFQKMKACLQRDMRKDENQFRVLASVSGDSLKKIGTVAEKGDKIVGLGEICRKLDGEDREPFWLPTETFSRKSSAKMAVTQVDVKVLPKSKEGRKEDPKKGAFEEAFQCVRTLEGFTWMLSKARVQCLELRKEKTDLLRENSEMKERMRFILENDVLRTSAPSYRKSYDGNLKLVASASACWSNIALT